MTSTTSRCPGNHMVFTPHPQCLNCKRLLTGYPVGYWYITPPAFKYECPQQLKKETE